MSITRNDDSVLFRTDAQIEASLLRQQRSNNTLGAPLLHEAKVLNLHCITQSTCLTESPFYLLFADSGGMCGVIDPSNEALEKKFTFRGHKGPVTCCIKVNEASNCNDTLLASSGWDGTVRIWSLKQKRCLTTVQLHEKYIKCMLVIEKNGQKMLLTGGSEGKIRATRLEDILASENSLLLTPGRGVQSEVFGEHARGVESLVQMDDSSILSCSSDGTIKKWPLNSCDTSLCLNEHDTNVCAIAVCDYQVFSASADRTARVWDLESKTPQKSVAVLQHPEYVRAVLVIFDGAYLLTGSSDSVIRIWDVSSATVFKTVEGHYDEVTCLILGPNQTVYSGSLDGTIRRWNVKDLLDPSIEFRFDAKYEKEQEISSGVVLTKEEEDELAELMED